ncbi:MAG: chemotaxis protein CheW [Candidatus Acidiferrales bacterium]|jgi:purine-binding chemotaxis protein CheW
MANTQQFCTFYLENYFFGIELLNVQEVLLQLELTEVPLAPYAVRGLMNLRGQIVIAVDLRRQLGLLERPADKPAMNVIVRTGEDAVSLLVDEIGDVVEVGEDTFEPPPETLRGKVRSAILGVHKLEKQLMHVLDTERACTVEERPVVAPPEH